MKTNKIRIMPKVTLIFNKNGKKTFIYPSIKRTQFFLKNKADTYLKKGYLITITVKYGSGIDLLGKKTVFHNSGTYGDLGGLKWAYQGFIKEYFSE